MCGIIGIIGKQEASPLILEALKRLEYRGYDSAGIATIHNKKLSRCRRIGKLQQLEKALKTKPLFGTIGIGHTRWATHGRATIRNAHPHRNEKFGVVHNGIIENYLPLKDRLIKSGVKFETETDTEIIVHLFSHYLDKENNLHKAAQKTFSSMEGSFALALLINGNEDQILIAKKNSPLAIGKGEGEMYIGSDAFSLAPFTQKICYLEDGDWAIITREKADIFDVNRKQVYRPTSLMDKTSIMVDKGTHRHFMAKEIFEQSEMLANCFASYLDLGKEAICLPPLPFSLKQFKHIRIVACGTAYYAARIASIWLEELAKLPCKTNISSEFRYANAPLQKNELVIFISQSGETADTLAALKQCKKKKAKTLAILNVMESSIAREADISIPIFAGTEIGVASTKAFTCQLATLASLTLAFATAHKSISQKQCAHYVRSLSSLSRNIHNVLENISPKIKNIAYLLAQYENALFIGRGTMWWLANEGALKLKEISYIHAEGFAAGELKHGSIALIDENMPVICLLPDDRHMPKTISNIKEIEARGGKLILIAHHNALKAYGKKPYKIIEIKQNNNVENKGKSQNNIQNITDVKATKEAIKETTEKETQQNTTQQDITKNPEKNLLTNPILFALPLQLLAYHTALAKGTDIDQPRNLAKSVTVE